MASPPPEGNSPEATFYEMIWALPLEDLRVRIVSARPDTQGQWHLDLLIVWSGWTPGDPAGSVGEEVLGSVVVGAVGAAP